MLKDFKDFISQGNLLAIAVAFVMGAAFSAIVNSLVNDVIMPIVARITGGLDFSSKFFVIKQGATSGPYNTVEAAKNAGAVTINYGLFINAIIVFIIVALVLFFIVRAYNKVCKADKAETTKNCPYCCESIPLDATRCPQCTSELPAAELAQA